MEMLVLRRKKAPHILGGHVPVGTGIPAGTGGSVEASVEIVDDVENLRRDADVLGATPPMPLALIKPAASGAASVGTIADGMAWGITAVGAADSPARGSGSQSSTQESTRPIRPSQASISSARTLAAATRTTFATPSGTALIAQELSSDGTSTARGSESHAA